MMERDLAMRWWESLDYDSKLSILIKYEIEKSVKQLTGKQIELIYKKEHKPIKL